MHTRDGHRAEQSSATRKLRHTCREQNMQKYHASGHTTHTNLPVPPARSSTPSLHHLLCPTQIPLVGHRGQSLKPSSHLHTRITHSLPKPSSCSPAGSLTLPSQAQLFSQTTTAESLWKAMSSYGLCIGKRFLFFWPWFWSCSSPQNL